MKLTYKISLYFILLIIVIMSICILNKRKYSWVNYIRPTTDEFLNLLIDNSWSTMYKKYGTESGMEREEFKKELYHENNRKFAR